MKCVRLLKNFEAFTLTQIKHEEELWPITKFILNVYYKHHKNPMSYPQYEFDNMLKEDCNTLQNSFFYVIRDEYGEIVGTIKSQKWDRKSTLCIQKDFNVNLQTFVNGLSHCPNEIFHIGRFAIDQDIIRKNNKLRSQRITILKILMYHALLPIVKNPSNIFFCECDEKLYSKLNYMGLFPEKIGATKFCMGSNTVPVYCNNEGIIQFFNQNQSLKNVS